MVSGPLLGVAVGVALLLSSCGGPEAIGPAQPTHSASSLPAPGAIPTTPAVGTAGPPPPAAPPAPLSLSGVRYVTPPGWEVTTPTPPEARLSSESGLAIVVRAAAGSTPPEVTAANGTRVGIDGSPGYQRGRPAPGGYLVQVDVVHAGTLYELRCTGADPQDVGNACDGFMLSMHWVG